MYTTLWATFLVAFVLSLVMTPAAIKLAPKIGAMDVPKDGRRMHVKAMPRFGGMAIFIGTMVSTAIFLLQLDTRIIGIMIGGTLIYILGVIDDLKNLPAKVKFLGQTVVAVIMYLYDIRIEFISNFFGDGRSELGAALCFIITILWIVGITNTVNLIDGLDGLASGVSLVYSMAMTVIFLYMASIMDAPVDMGQARQTQYAAELNSMAVFAAAVAGGCLGFLRFNSFPAKVFMGDTGSLALGGAIAAMAVFSRAVLLLPIMGACFVASAVSVILQVGSYKLRRKRIFKMAPLHHHFELLGYSETKIVAGYMIVTTLLCLVCLLAFQ